MATTAQRNDRMNAGGTNGHERWWNIVRIVGWSIIALLLLLPGVAALFTDQVQWSLGDFLFAALLLCGSGLVFELILGRSSSTAYRTGAMVALAAAFGLVWSNAAVGFVGSGANTANILYAALLALPLLGGVLTRLSARGLSRTMVLTAVAQGAITAFAFGTGHVSAEERAILLAINTGFILLWAASAVLFHQAAEGESSPGVEAQDSTSTGGAKVQVVLSLLLVAIGVVMLGYMISVEGEPGAVPLLVVLLGAGWFFFARFRSKAAHGK